MPARQLTPGSNTLKAPDNVFRPHIIQKRTFSEILPDDEPRLSKKYRKELEILNNDDKNSSNSNSHKDSKKKRKKRRRKSSLTNSEIDPVKQIPKSITTAVSASVASSSTLSEASMLLPIMEVEADHIVLRAESLAMEADERPALTVSVKLLSWLMLTICVWTIRLQIKERDVRFWGFRMILHWFKDTPRSLDPPMRLTH